MKLIGYITANIAGDARYTTRIEVWSDGRACEVRISETGAVGGMDGPGGRFNVPGRVLATTTCEPARVARVVRDECNRDHVIKRYGKATKKFVWLAPCTHYTHVDNIVARGISAAKVAEVLELNFG